MKMMVVRVEMVEESRVGIELHTYEHLEGFEPATRGQIVRQ
jgi:hypothetical protein